MTHERYICLKTREGYNITVEKGNSAQSSRDILTMKGNSAQSSRDILPMKGNSAQSSHMEPVLLP